MNAVTTFTDALKEWLAKNGFGNLNLVWDEDFAYGLANNTLYVGITLPPEITEYFEEFLVENGCEYSGLVAPAYALLHELGHSQTIYQFSFEELVMFKFFKEDDDDTLTDREFMFHYWNVEDEWVANEWAINFINNNADAICELHNIYCDYWNAVLHCICSDKTQKGQS